MKKFIQKNQISTLAFITALPTLWYANGLLATVLELVILFGTVILTDSRRIKVHIREMRQQLNLQSFIVVCSLAAAVYFGVAGLLVIAIDIAIGSLHGERFSWIENPLGRYLWLGSLFMYTLVPFLFNWDTFAYYLGFRQKKPAHIVD